MRPTSTGFVQLDRKESDHVVALPLPRGSPFVSAPEEVVRTRRIEVVDGHGRPRVVIGDLGPDTGDAGDAGNTMFGIALLDDHGRHRAWLGLHPHGAGLTFDREGNAALELGVDDPHPEVVRPGAYLHLADVDGRPAVGCRVGDDGEVAVHGLAADTAAAAAEG
jgi:hypothetical protein